MTLDLVKYVIKNENNMVLGHSGIWIDPLLDPDFVHFYNDYFEARDILNWAKVYSEEPLSGETAKMIMNGVPELVAVNITYEFDWTH